MDISAIQSMKLFFLELTDLSRDGLHVYAGMLIFLLSAALLKKKLYSPIPLLLVLAVAAGVEALDARDDMQLFGYWRVGESMHDVFNTVVWPTVLFFLCRFTALARRE